MDLNDEDADDAFYMECLQQYYCYRHWAIGVAVGLRRVLKRRAQRRQFRTRRSPV